MELNALDFVSKYKDLIINGVVVDPALDKAQSLYLNTLVVYSEGGCSQRKAQSNSLFGPNDVFKKTLTLLSLIGKEFPVVIKHDCLPIIKELTGLTSFDENDEAWYYIATLLCDGHTLLRCRNTYAYQRSDDDLYLRINGKIPLLSKFKPKTFNELWEEFEAVRFSCPGGVEVERFFTSRPFYCLDYDDVRGVNINIKQRG